MTTQMLDVKALEERAKNAEDFGALNKISASYAKLPQEQKKELEGLVVGKIYELTKSRIPFIKTMSDYSFFCSEYNSTVVTGFGFIGDKKPAKLYEIEQQVGNLESEIKRAAAALERERLAQQPKAELSGDAAGIRALINGAEDIRELKEKLFDLSCANKSIDAKPYLADKEFKNEFYAGIGRLMKKKLGDPSASAVYTKSYLEVCDAALSDAKSVLEKFGVEYSEEAQQILKRLKGQRDGIRAYAR